MEQKVVKLEARGKASQQGMLSVETFTKSQRIKKATTKGFVGLLVTCVLVAIPLLHFFLVPIGLVATGIMVSSALNQEARIVGGTALCPYCEQSFEMVARKEKYPFLERCPNCSRESSVTEHL